MQKERKARSRKRHRKKFKKEEGKKRTAEQFLQAELMAVKMPPKGEGCGGQTGEEPALCGKAQEKHLPELHNCDTELPCPCLLLQAVCSWGRDHVFLPFSALMSAIKYFSALVKHVKM